MSATAQDAFGRALLDYQRGGEGGECAYRDPERGDVVHRDLGDYFAVPDDGEELLLDRARGEVLDVGCGAGRHSLYLAERGHGVLATDRSPGAVRVCRRRGIERCLVTDIERLALAGDVADTVLVIGSQLGIPDDVAGLETLLRGLARVTRDGGLLVADAFDPEAPAASSVLGYRDRPEDGLAERRFQVEYDGAREPITLLMVSPDRLRDAVAPTPWREAAVVYGSGRDDGYYRVALTLPGGG